jgi:DNA-3-methyladenine glycosylase I
MSDFNLKTRCDWAGASQQYMEYHDQEWGVPAHDDRRLFEMLILEGAQAGLSWSLILRKRDGYRQAFDGFNAEQIARYDERAIERLLANPEIIRNRLKIQATIQNARTFLEVQSQPGGFDAFIWRFVDGRTLQNAWPSVKDIPARSAESDAMSKELKRLGFTFVGSTICYAFMQAVGMVNDHITTCFRWQELQAPDHSSPSPS